MNRGISAAKYFGDEQDKYDEACFTTAERNGHTVAEAEMCDDGSAGCPGCPFKKHQEGEAVKRNTAADPEPGME